MPTKEKKYLNVDNVVKDRLCLGCGICYSSCPARAINFSIRRGLYLPAVNMDKCNSDKGCDVCLRVCPGIGIDIEQESNRLFPCLEADFDLGRYENCYTAYSADYEVRYHSASGGVVTQLLVDMLESDIIQGALVTRMKAAEPLMTDVILAATKEEIIQSQSSKYCPVPVGIGLKDIMNKSGKFAVVGLPCHIHAFRKAEKVFPWLSDKIHVYLGIYCSSTKSFSAAEYLLDVLFGVDKKMVKKFAYRDDGCLGDMKVELKNGKIEKHPYKEYYPKLRSFFIPYRCTLCIDHTAELADISIGDIYIPEYWNDKVGTSSVIVRSRRGAQIFDNSVKKGSLISKELDSSLLKKSQNGMLVRKKLHIVIRFIFLRLLGKKMPQYDVRFPVLSFKQAVKYFISTLVLYTEILIGKQKRFWFLITQVNRILEKK